jgi:tRNA (adenine57-N1/adenine58-N1)-methyltransferase
LVPTTNQVSETLRAMKGLPLVDVEVSELLLRHYKPNPDRLRPEDRMVAHTAFLLFARKQRRATSD